MHDVNARPLVITCRRYSGRAGTEGSWIPGRASLTCIVLESKAGRETSKSCRDVMGQEEEGSGKQASGQRGTPPLIYAVNDSH